MRHFKNSNNEFFGIDVGQEHLIKPDWVETTLTDINATNAPAFRITELKQLLFNSDYKVLPDYDKPNEDIKKQRQAWRDEIRSLGG